MNEFSIVYLGKRLFERIILFFDHWYAGSFRAIARRTIGILESFDRTLAWRITLQNFFQPLYQDHTIVGHLFGFVFRAIRLVIGSIVYVALIVCAILVYVVWAGIPIYILYRGFIAL